MDRATARVPVLSDPSRTVPVGVHQCSRCRSLFVVADVLGALERRFGVLLFERVPQAATHGDRKASRYSSDSVLSRYGYFAGAKTDPGEKARHAIIEMLVATRISSLGEIENLLGRFVRERADRFDYAGRIWERDLRFVNGLGRATASEYVNVRLIRKRR